MKNNTLFGLAFLNYNWEHNKKDLLDTYIPLVGECIVEKKYNDIDRDIIKQTLSELYGLNTPLGTIESLLRRMVKMNYLKRESGIYKINDNEILKLHQRTTKNQLSDDYNTFIKNLLIFSKKNFNSEYSEKEMEVGFLDFLKAFDLDIITSENDTFTPVVQDKKKLKYIISKFILSIRENSSIDFKKIVAIAQGHAIANLVALEKLNSFVGNLNSLDIYLDAPIVFNLLGINGDSNMALSKELISTLKDNGANLKIFTINQKEVVKTIKDAIERLKSGSFDIKKSSRILRTAIRESYSYNSLQIKLNQLEEIYSDLNITIVDTPQIIQEYAIDESKLQDIIENIYKLNKSAYLPWYTKNQIENDVQTISFIFQIRKNTSINSLKNSKAILLTVNEAIAFASKNKNISNYGKYSYIPPCLTDIFLSTILWANYPSKNEELNIKRLISECYSNIELDNKLFMKFYEDIEKMHTDHKISDEQYYVLNSTNVAYKLLEEKTLNDIDEYTDKTPAEIVEETIKSYRYGEILMSKNIKKIAKGVATFIFWLIFSVIVVAVIATKFISNFADTFIGNFFWILSIPIALFGIFRWGNMIPPREKITSWVEKKTYNMIMQFLKRR